MPRAMTTQQVSTMLDLVAGDRAKATLDTTTKIRSLLCLIGLALAAAPLFKGPPQGTYIEPALACKIISAFFAIFFLQFFFVPAFFLSENFTRPPSPATGLTMVTFFMRVGSISGLTIVYLGLTLDAATMYPVLCAFQAAITFFGPLRGELIFDTTPKHIVPPIIMCIAGGVLFTASL